jgi:hypothetical protein
MRGFGRLALVCVLGALAALAPLAAFSAETAPETGAKGSEGASAPPLEPLAPDAAPGKIIKEPASFHGLKWGTKLEDVKDMQVLGEYENMRYATVPGTVYRIGDVFINEVVYAFCKNGFGAVRLEFSGRDKLDAVKKIIAEKYTEPLRLDGEEERYALPLGNVLIRIEYDGKKDVGALGYYYRPIYEQCSQAPGKTN